ncbi:hypothetical protein HMPREF1093_00563 [Hungatella hathewayi 12489931]|nr:hypothetical protein HMPREF1093_00563 [Hungatella hathewayi 12489931]
MTGSQTCACAAEEACMSQTWACAAEETERGASP